MSAPEFSSSTAKIIFNVDIEYMSIRATIFWIQFYFEGAKNV